MCTSNLRLKHPNNVAAANGKARTFLIDYVGEMAFFLTVFAFQSYTMHLVDGVVEFCIKRAVWLACVFAHVSGRESSFTAYVDLTTCFVTSNFRGELNVLLLRGCVPQSIPLKIHCLVFLNVMEPMI